MRFFLILAMIFFVGCEAKSPRKESPKTPSAAAETASAVKVDYETTLWQDYGDNAAAADVKYKGKEIEMTARGKVDTDSSGKYHLSCMGMDPDRRRAGVICLISPKDTDKLSKAKPNAAFKIRGICKGKKADPGAYNGYIVTVDDCHIIHVLTWNGKEWAPD